MSNLTLYNSSAGSGKTYTLVKEFLIKALDQTHTTSNYYKHILAVTFTNKAAAEMKERVIKALKEIASKEKLEGTTAFLLADLIKPKSEGGLGIDKNTLEKKCEQVLRSILHNYNDLAISTIDKFTHKIIRTFAHDLHLPLNFEIELDEQEILSKAIDLLIAQVGKNEALTKLLIDFSKEKADNENSWNIDKDLYVFAKNLLKDNGEFYIKQLNKLAIEDFHTIRKELFVQIKLFESEITSISENAIDFVNKQGIEEKSFYRGYLVVYFKKIQKFSDFEANPTLQKMMVDEQNWYSKTVPESQKQLIDANKSTIIAYYDAIQNHIAENESAYIINKLLLKYSYTLAVINEIEKTIQEVKEEIAKGAKFKIPPENMEDNYVVYVSNVNNPTSIVGYRDGSVWYDETGTEISDPSVLGPSSGPYLVDADDNVVSSKAFKDYKPQINYMPRIAFSFPISDEALFFAHYDVLTKRPYSNRLDPTNYLFIHSMGTNAISNP
ncbi:MAG: hypothetical protein CVT95_10405, partial [Bacteroidetes bacterium HGW-Bacteroidetes-12]